jgi:hypothetical protein
VTEVLWLSAHGGAGTTTLRRCIGFGNEIASLRSASPDSVVVVVARTSAEGLRRAQQIAAVHASKTSTELLGGLVLVADAPGKLPRPLEDLARLVTGGYTDSWRIPWIEAARLGEPPDLAKAPRIVRALREQLLFVCAERSSAPKALGASTDLRRVAVESNTLPQLNGAS